MRLFGPSSSTSARVNVPSPAPRSAHVPPAREIAPPISATASAVLTDAPDSPIALARGEAEGGCAPFPGSRPRRRSLDCTIAPVGHAPEGFAAAHRPAAQLG